MRCIFCKIDSSKSKSVEHNIPESLGNKEHILQPKIVCDKCNHYFSIKIEKPLLEQPYFRNLRFEQAVQNKKGNYIPEKGFLVHPQGGLIELSRDMNGNPMVIIEDKKVVETFKSLKQGEIIYPHFDLPSKEDKIISRFLGKIGLETIASMLQIDSDDYEEFINHRDFEELRNYVRYGKPDKVWPYYLRRIYPAEKDFFEKGIGYQTMHEYMVLHTDQNELYIVLALFGVEYCLNLGGPELEGYEIWLQNHNFISPLDSDFCSIGKISTIN
jgi:HNH endonuclease